MNWVFDILLGIGVMLTGIGLSTVASQRDAAQRESCSYYKCECLYAEKRD